MTSCAPDVSVVIVSYNLGPLLRCAVESATTQTLRAIEVIIVDDHSTDDTATVAAELCADDPRVRFVQLPINSGGAGGPRNRGIQEASAKYVVFLDGDDVLERHALKNLYNAAETFSASLVAGRTERVMMSSGVRTPWYRQLYQELRVIDSIDEFPELIHDTNSTSKLYLVDYLRSSGLEFETNRHYEDVIFTAELYACVGRTVVIPEVVYDWRIYPEEERKSITHQRDDLSNLADRIYSLQKAAATFSGTDPIVQSQFSLKVLRHHARLYLNDTLELDDVSALHVLQSLKPVIQAQPPEEFDVLFPYERFMYAAALQLDLVGVRKAVVAEREGLSAGHFKPTDDGTLTWSAAEDAQFDDSDDFVASLRTVTDERLVRFPLDQVHLLHEASGLSIDGDRLAVTGSTDDPFGEFANLVTGVNLRSWNPELGEVGRVPTDWSCNAGKIQWSASIQLPRRQSFRERRPRDFQIELVLRTGKRIVDNIRTPTGHRLSVNDRTLAGRLLADKWITEGPRYSNLAFSIAQGKRGTIIRSLEKAARTRVRGPAKRLANPARRMYRRTTAVVRPRGDAGMFFYRAARRLPVQKRTALFESQLGQNVSGSPLAVYKELSRRDSELDVTWVTPNGRPDDQVANARNAIREGWTYLYRLARSEFLVDDQSFPRFFEKRDGQRYLQTWHGIPLKKMGIDEERFQTEDEVARLRRVSAQWDGLVVPNPYFEKTFVPAFMYEGERVKYGTPRCDELVRGDVDADALKQKLGVPSERRIVLYAPTFRAQQNGKGRLIPLPFDLNEFKEALPTDVVLITRSHYLNRFHIPKRSAGFCIDGSFVPNINELYAAADVLITDYSSVMFDFAVTGKPIVIYAYDWDDYRNHSRGTYFDLKAKGPGIFTEDEESLFSGVKSALESTPSVALERFRMTYSGWEDGNASARAVDFLLRTIE